MVYKSVYLDTSKQVICSNDCTSKSSITKMRNTVLDRLSLTHLITVWIITIAAFGFIYHGLTFINQPLVSDGEPLTKDLNGLGNGIYFSFITALTIGYNDIVPTGYAKLAVIIEAILSVGILGLFISKITTDRQEELIQETTSEDLANAAITELYMYRNDIKGLPATKKGYKEYQEALANLKLALINISKARVQDPIRVELVTNSINFSLSKTKETTEKFSQWKKESTTTAECLRIAKEIYAQYKSEQSDENTKVGEKLKDLDKTLQALQESLGTA